MFCPKSREPLLYRAIGRPPASLGGQPLLPCLSQQEKLWPPAPESTHICHFCYRAGPLTHRDVLGSSAQKLIMLSLELCFRVEMLCMAMARKNFLRLKQLFQARSRKRNQSVKLKTGDPRPLATAPMFGSSPDTPDLTSMDLSTIEVCIKFPAGFRLLCSDSSRNKVNNRLPAVGFSVGFQASDN